MVANIFSEIPKVKIQQIFLDVLTSFGVELFIQRDDLLHEEVSGNKWRKLSNVLMDFDRNKNDGVISFGGPFSNHLAATSEACKLLDIPFVAYVRGYKSSELSVTLQKLLSNNHKIHWCSKEEFKTLRSKNWPNPSVEEYGKYLIIPEGGSGSLALKACADISINWEEKFDYACCAIGTGTTFSGMVNGLPKVTKGLGFVMLKDRNYLDDEVLKMVYKNPNYQLNRDYAFNGFGKVNDELIEFMNEFYINTEIKLDPIYTGKLLFGILDLVKRNYFKRGSKIIAIHTGGLQGINGMNSKRIKKGQSVLNYCK